MNVIASIARVLLGFIAISAGFGIVAILHEYPTQIFTCFCGVLILIFTIIACGAVGESIVESIQEGFLKHKSQDKK